MHSNSRIYSTELAIYEFFFGETCTTHTRAHARAQKASKNKKKQLDHEPGSAPPRQRRLCLLVHKGNNRPSPQPSPLSRGPPTAPVAGAANLDGRLAAVPSLMDSRKHVWLKLIAVALSLVNHCITRLPMSSQSLLRLSYASVAG